MVGFVSITGGREKKKKRKKKEKKRERERERRGLTTAADDRRIGFRSERADVWQSTGGA
jgi:hypothetical protein